MVAFGDREPCVGQHLLGEAHRGGAVGACRVLERVGRFARDEVVRQRVGDAATRDVHVVGVEVVADVATTEAGRGDERGAAAHERVEHEVVRIRVQPDQLLGQLDGERRRVADALRALGRDRPQVEREAHEVVGHQRALVRQAGRRALLGRAGPIEATLAGHHDPLGDVAQHGVRGAAERTPRARAVGALALLPHDLATQQQTEVVLQDVDDVGRQAAVRLASEVRHVHGDAPAGLEHAHAVGEHVAQHLQVLEVRAGHAFTLELLLVLLAREVRR